ncbi:reverse transcriptase domain-containing protein [Tanacetum coccineum]
MLEGVNPSDGTFDSTAGNKGLFSTGPMACVTEVTTATSGFTDASPNCVTEATITTAPPHFVVNNGIQHVVNKQDNTIGRVSFATLLKGESSRKQVNYRTLPAPAGNEEGCSYRKGVVCNVPLILKKRSPYANIMKEDLCNFPIWVKFHDIWITAFTEDGLSAIATKLGTPLMLDSYTTDMCFESCGRSSYARAMIELRADVESKETIVMDIPKFMSGGYTRSIIRNLKMPRQAAPRPPVGLKPKFNFDGKLFENFDALEISVKNDEYNPVWGERGLNTTPLAELINKVERQMLNGKLMLVDDDGKPLNKVDFDPVHSDSDSDVEVAYGETAQFMDSGGANDASLYEDEDHDTYDTYDIEGLMKQELALCDMMDINLRGRSRR